MKMKFLVGSLMAAGCWAITGCGGGSTPTNTVENASQSEIDEYNRMLQEAQADMQKSDEAQKAGGF